MFAEFIAPTVLFKTTNERRVTEKTQRLSRQVPQRKA